MNNLRSIRRIVTHSGRFHADEVFAIAFLLVFLQKKPGELPIERTRRNLSAELSDQTVVVIDIGRVHETALNNFDHHQETGGEAALVLVLKAANPWYTDVLLKQIFGQISDRDIGKPVRNAGLSFSSAIGIINEQEGSEDAKFQIALGIAYNIMLGLVTKFEKVKQFQTQIPQFRKLCEDKVLLAGKVHLPRNWKDIVPHGVQFVISGSDRRWFLAGRNKIISTVTQTKLLPNDVAIYPSEDAAIHDACSFLSSPPCG